MMFKIGAAFAVLGLHFLHVTYANDVCITVEPTPAQKSHAIDTIQELGKKISYAQWDNNPTSNVVLSSLSIAIILNLLMAGTDESTSSEIKEALNYANDLEECAIHKTFQSIFISLQGGSGSEVEISLYTRFFPQEGFSFINSFISISSTYYFSDVQNLDYENNAVNATDIINKWVFDSSKGKIPELFADTLSSETLLIIVNVIFFNATWENKFQLSNTENGTFKTETGDITIPMMKRKMDVPYLNDSVEGLQIISLPYVGNRFSMYILKPTDDSSVSLKEIENNTTPSNLNNLIDQMESTLVEVTIPRMKLEFSLKLNDDVKDLGINEIFGPESNFERMTEVPDLAVTEIVHKAVLEVAENGTVAAAVTSVIIGPTSATDSAKFTLDKPSLLFIRDNENNLTLFSAKVMKPEPIW